LFSITLGKKKLSGSLEKKKQKKKKNNKKKRSNVRYNTAKREKRERERERERRMELFKTVYPSEFYNKFLSNNIRPDGRTLEAVRKTSVSFGSITSAVGSAFLKQGNTSITAGVKLEYGPPPASVSSQLGNDV